MRRKRAVLVTCLLLILLAGGTTLWLRAQRRQYMLNRALIGALVKYDYQQASALVQAGADPNTRYTPLSTPSIQELLALLLHRLWLQQPSLPNTP